MTIAVVTPAAKLGGGNLEILHLLEDLEAAGEKNISLMSMWNLRQPMDTGGVRLDLLTGWYARRGAAIWQMPFICMKFLMRRFASRSKKVYVFTHYSTYALSYFVPRRQTGYFVQDLEWEFLSAPLAKRLLRSFILGRLATGKVIAANDYLAQQLSRAEIVVAGVYPIWADSKFLSPLEGESMRDFDVCMVLRKGAHKRLDLQAEFVRLAGFADLRIALITPDEPDDVWTRASHVQIFLSPHIDTMRSIYERSKVSLLLSEHEGFGLPPLEGMGAGCVPVVRDAGGVRAYMDTRELAGLVIDRSVGIDEILRFILALIADEKKLAALSTHAKERFIQGLQRKSQRIDTAAHLVELAAEVARD